MYFLREFKKFLVRGNVLDLAVGIVTGAAFGKIVSSFVADVLMPPIGLMLGRVNFSNLFVDLSGHGYASLSAAKAAGAPTLNYGVFLNNVLDFVIIAFAVFLVIKAFNKLYHHETEKAAAANPPPASEQLLTDIRNLLRQIAEQQSSGGKGASQV